MAKRAFVVYVLEELCRDDIEPGHPAWDDVAHLLVRAYTIAQGHDYYKIDYVLTK